MTHRIALTALTTIVAILTATHAFAQGVSIVSPFTGTEPTYNRVNAGEPPTNLSTSFGTAAPYVTIPFSVSITGSYNLLFAATLDNGLGNTSYIDTFLTIYSGTFDPASPLTNAVFAIDDFVIEAGNAASAGFTLTAGTSYVFVGTTFDNGAYTGTSTVSIGNETRPTGSIVNPGVTVVPEAGTLTILLPALGIAGTVIIRRRRAA